MKNTAGQRAATRTPEAPRSISPAPNQLQVSARLRTGKFDCTILNPLALRTEGVNLQTIDDHCFVDGQRRSRDVLGDPSERRKVYDKLVPLVALTVANWQG